MFNFFTLTTDELALCLVLLFGLVSELLLSSILIKKAGRLAGSFTFCVAIISFIHLFRIFQFQYNEPIDWLISLNFGIGIATGITSVFYIANTLSDKRRKKRLHELRFTGYKEAVYGYEEALKNGDNIQANTMREHLENFYEEAINDGDEVLATVILEKMESLETT